MEQKKILWILLSVTLFLFIVSITGVVWFFPGRIAVAEGDDNNSENQEQASIDFDPVEWVREGENFPGLMDSPSDEEEGFSIVYGETDSGEPVVNLVADNTIKEVENKPTNTIVNKSPVATVNTPVKVVSGVVSNVAVPAPKKIDVLEYWIQAGSFSSRSRADSSSQSLAEKGFSNLITIKTVDSKDFFRVRMGPYLSKAEAEKFLQWIKEIDSYEKSYISQVYVQKTVN
ncbi:MAG: SPOR domain-containing protein [Spirochaetota bacterium]|nr:SPOR domain-containing protein [Spirochaetota bacterium]